MQGKQKQMGTESSKEKEIYKKKKKKKCSLLIENYRDCGDHGKVFWGKARSVSKCVRKQEVLAQQ